MKIEVVCSHPFRAIRTASLASHPIPAPYAARNASQTGKFRYTRSLPPTRCSGEGRGLRINTFYKTREETRVLACAATPTRVRNAISAQPASFPPRGHLTVSRGLRCEPSCVVSHSVRAQHAASPRAQCDNSAQAGASECVDCPRGKYRSEMGPSCKHCEPGTASSETGAAQCKEVRPLVRLVSCHLL